MRKISILGILIGMVSLIIIDGVLGEILLPRLFGGTLTENATLGMHDTSFMFLMLRTVAGIFALVAGGYITAKIAKASFYLNTGIVGILSLSLTISAYNDSYPVWFNIVGFLFLIPAALLGGYFVSKKKKAQEAPLNI